MTAPVHITFEMLVHDVAVELGIAAPMIESEEEDSQVAEVEFDGVSMVLISNADRNDDTLSLFCRLGAVPADERRTRALEGLMEINYSMLSGGRMRFGLDGESGDVVLAITGDIDSIGASLVAKTIREFSDMAKRWSRTYFLDEDSVHVSFPTGALIG